MLVFFIIAILIDYRIHKEKSREEEEGGQQNYLAEEKQKWWFVRFLLHTLGYTDAEGKKQSFKSQVCFNPFECCSCKCRDVREDPWKYWKMWSNFLSVFILSLGVALLFGGGVGHEPVCLFNALRTDFATDLEKFEYPLLFHEKNGFNTTDSEDTSYTEPS